MNISLGVQYYNDFKNILFNNLILFLILVLFYYYFGISILTIVLTPIIMLIYYVVKHVSRMFNFLASMHIDQCLNYSSKIIFKNRVKPIAMRPDLLDRKLSDFLINSSHNTYIPCTQHVDLASTDSIIATLKMGARVIELDCFMKDNTENDTTPIVTHGSENSKKGDLFLTNPITFEECIKTIANYGFTTSDPLIICLELNTNKNNETHQKMIDIIKKYLGDKLLTSEFKLNRGKNRRYINDTPMRELLGKAIFLCGGGYTDNITEIIDGSFKEDRFGNASNNKTDITVPNGVIQRIYPAGNFFSHLSYNFDPEPFWNAGCQIVALNFNKVDKDLRKNFEKFLDYSFVPKN